MRSSAIVLTVCSAGLLFGDQQLNVSLCNLGALPESTIASAKAETGAVFRVAGVQVRWMPCDEFPVEREAPLIVRLRIDIMPRTAGPVSLDAMGRASVTDEGAGQMADAYFLAIQAVSLRYDVDAGVLLGFVVAHELGHLLLGPGHAPDGLMQAAFGKKEMAALRQRWLRFNQECATRIRRELLRRTAASDAAAPGK